MKNLRHFYLWELHYVSVKVVDKNNVGSNQGDDFSDWLWDKENIKCIKNICIRIHLFPIFNWTLVGLILDDNH